ncbi:hypothetical protein LEN26_004512 [Aphanomyces euteiches]|nr:hypothetical protein LEN26_004512 [Aphanomyces euteiches]
MNTLFCKIDACRTTLEGYSAQCTMTGALKKLRSCLKRAKLESKYAVVEHMLPLAASVRAKLLSSLDATVVQATCGVVALFARQLGAAFAPFADVLLVPLLDGACVRRLSAKDPTAISMASTYCVEALAATTVLNVETLYGYYKAARATRNQRLKRHLVVKVLGITVETWTKAELDPRYSLLKEFVREALHDKFLLFRVESRQVFSSLYDRWPERVNELVYMPAPRIRAVLMVDGYASTGIGLALQQKFLSKACPRPAAVKRDPPKVVDHCRRPAAAVEPDMQRGGLSHAVGCAALGCVVHDDRGGIAVVAQFWTHVKGQTTHEQPCAEGEASPMLESTKHPTMQTRSKEPLRSMDLVRSKSLVDSNMGLASPSAQGCSWVV